MFSGGFAAFDGVPSPDEVQDGSHGLEPSCCPNPRAQEQLHRRLEAALPVWLVCESPWRGSRYRVRVADSDKPGLHRLTPTMLQALDDRLVSAQLPRLELVRSNPEQRVNHRFSDTIAGVVLVKLPPVLAAAPWPFKADVLQNVHSQVMGVCQLIICVLQALKRVRCMSCGRIAATWRYSKWSRLCGSRR